MQIPDTIATHLENLRSVGASELADDIANMIEEAPDPTAPALSADDIVKVIEAEAAAEVKVERARAATEATATAAAVEQTATMIEAQAEQLATVLEAEAEQLDAVIEAEAEQLDAVLDADDTGAPEPLPNPSTEGEPPKDTHWLLRTRGNR